MKAIEFKPNNQSKFARVILEGTLIALPLSFIVYLFKYSWGIWLVLIFTAGLAGFSILCSTLPMHRNKVISSAIIVFNGLYFTFLLTILPMVFAYFLDICGGSLSCEIGFLEFVGAILSSESKIGGLASSSSGFTIIEGVYLTVEYLIVALASIGIGLTNKTPFDYEKQEWAEDTDLIMVMENDVFERLSNGQIGFEELQQKVMISPKTEQKTANDRKLKVIRLTKLGKNIAFVAGGSNHYYLLDDEQSSAITSEVLNFAK
jgi:hypothetical protein